jgi:hypothetical protein
LHSCVKLYLPVWMIVSTAYLFTLVMNIIHHSAARSSLSSLNAMNLIVIERRLNSVVSKLGQT